MGLFDEFRKVFGAPNVEHKKPAPRGGQVGRTVAVSSTDNGEQIRLWPHLTERESREAMRDYRERNTSVFGG